MAAFSSPVARAEMLIRCPVSRVFAAFTDPAETTRFWFTKSSGPLVEGAKLTWDWEMYGASGEIDVLKVEEDRRILIAWPTPVEWEFAVQGPNETQVTITATGFDGTADEQVAQAIDSMGGFTQVLAGCKAWLEHGIELNLIHDKNPVHHVQQ